MIYWYQTERVKVQPDIQGITRQTNMIVLCDYAKNKREGLRREETQMNNRKNITTRGNMKEIDRFMINIVVIGDECDTN